MDVVSQFTKEVNDLVDDYCDNETRKTYSHLYSVKVLNEKRLVHMMKYIQDNNIDVPPSQYAKLADATEAFLHHVQCNDGKYYLSGDAFYKPQQMTLGVREELLQYVIDEIRRKTSIFVASSEVK